MKKCDILTLQRGKVLRSEGIKLLNGSVMKDIEGSCYKNVNLGILETDRIKENEMKSFLRQDYTRRLCFILKSKLHGRYKITAIKNSPVSVLRYGAGILKDKPDGPKKIFGALHPKSDVRKIYLLRKDGGRELIGCEDSIRREENSFG